MLLAPVADRRERVPKEAVFDSESVSSDSLIPELIARDEGCLVAAGVDALEAVERDPVERVPDVDAALFAINPPW